MYLLNYLKFLLKSTNQHGVHSPFVYDLVTTCFYDTSTYPTYTVLRKLAKEKEIRLSKAKLIVRLAHYFKFARAVVIPENKTLEKILVSANPQSTILSIRDLSHEETAIDFVYLSATVPNQFEEILEKILSSLHNDSVLMVDAIHTSKANRIHWSYLKKHPQISVSIDTFGFGLLFFRKEQLKEHFVIRL